MSADIEGSLFDLEHDPACPSCNSSLKRIFSKSGEKPEPGDLTVCLACLASLEFADHDGMLVVRLLKDEDFAEMSEQTQARHMNVKAETRKNRKLLALATINAEAMIYDGMEDALIGVACRAGHKPVAVYDQRRAAAVAQAAMSIDREKAEEVVRKKAAEWHGPDATPVFVMLFADYEVVNTNEP